MKAPAHHPELDFAAAVTEGPAASAPEVEWMKGELRGRGWRLASELGGQTEGQKRRLRAIARASQGHIISGDRGYRLTVEAEHAEYWQARDRLKSQADDMIARVAEIDRVWHNRPGI